jgi:hypothetical protein
MSEELVSRTPCISFGLAQQVGAVAPETIEISQWDHLLAKLGLTEREALDAILVDGDIGHSIRRFVQDSFRHHFVPEDVLLAVGKQRKTENVKARDFSPCQPFTIEGHPQTADEPGRRHRCDDHARSRQA